VQCRQLPNVGRQLAERLATAGMGSLKQLAKADPRRIEAVTQRNYPFGASRQLSKTAV
jgi:ATP-dependent DNA helicase HFM1/MER3